MNDREGAAGIRVRRLRSASGRAAASLGVIAALMLGAAAAALAEEACAITDASCALQTSVDDAVRDAQEVVDGATEGPQDQVDKAVGGASDTVNGLLGSGGDPGGGDPDGGSGPGPSNEDDAKGPSRGPNEHRSRPAAPDNRRGATGETSIGRPSPERAGSAPVMVTTAGVERRPSSEAGSGIVPILRETAVGLALPLVVVMTLMGLFIAVQNRIDRRDPKLALASLQPRDLTFG